MALRGTLRCGRRNTFVILVGVQYSSFLVRLSIYKRRWKNEVRSGKVSNTRALFLISLSLRHLENISESFLFLFYLSTSCSFVFISHLYFEHPSFLCVKILLELPIKIKQARHVRWFFNLKHEIAVIFMKWSDLERFSKKCIWYILFQ